MDLSTGRVAPALLAALSLVSGCAPKVGVRDQEPALFHAAEYASAATGEELSRATLAALAELGHEPDESLEVLLAALDEAPLLPRWRAGLAGAELCLEAAEPGSEEGSELLLRCALACLDALEVLDAPSIGDPRHQRIALLYGVALGRLFTELGARAGHPRDWPALSDGTRTYRLELAQGPDAWDPAYFDAYTAADTLEVIGFRNRHWQPGWGAPLVGLRENGPPTRETHPYYPPEGILYPVTAVLERGAREDELRLELLDPMRVSEVRLAGAARPLAADLTAPFATLIGRAELQDLAILGLLRADRAGFHEGLFLLEPYDPNKLPVVLVHGLLSSPFTWHEPTNELRGDPFVRRHCQVWHYMYPTGAPILAAAGRMRETLAEAKRALDPEGDDPAWQDVLLVGHSMGGLLTKLMVQSSGDAVWSSKHRLPLDDLELSDEDRETARSFFFYEPLPYVHRVVFVATPHRGSRTADSWVGRLGSALVQVPGEVAGWLERMIEANPDVLKADVYTDAPSSIDILSPSNVVLMATADLPVAEGVLYHSIHGADDDVVSIESSRLPGAVSDLVVPGDHNVHETARAVAEVRRIVRLHLAERGDGTP